MRTATFLGCQSGTGGQVVFVGLPFDHGSTAHHGCAKAPAVIRMLTSVHELGAGSLFDLGQKRVILEGSMIFDLGDIAYRASQSRENYRQFVRRATTTLAREGKKLLALGGDHLVTLPLVEGLADVHKTIQIVQLDAHSDYIEVAADTLPTHANFMHRIAKIPAVKRIVQIGVRGSSTYQAILPDKIKHCSPDELNRYLLPDVPVYLTVDTDGFDPGVAPAVGHPEPGGLSWANFEEILRQIVLANLPLIGADWTEYNPAFDPGNYLTGRMVTAGLIQITASLASSSPGVIR